MPGEDEELLNRLVLARIAEGQSALLRELAETRRELSELRASHAKEIGELRTSHAKALEEIEKELGRHREVEGAQATVVAQYSASLEADRKALAEIRAVKAEGKAGLLTLFTDQRVIGALIAIALAVGAFFAGANNGTAAPPTAP